MRREVDWHASCIGLGCGALSTLFQSAEELHLGKLGLAKEVHEAVDDCISYGLANAGGLSHFGSSPNARQFDQFRFNDAGDLSGRRRDHGRCFGFM